MTEQTTDDITRLVIRLHEALDAMPREHKTIDDIEQAIREEAGERADAIIDGVHASVAQAQAIDLHRAALRVALDDIAKRATEARRALARLASDDVYDVEMVDGAAQAKITAALNHIDLLVDAARANAPKPGQ